LREGAVMAPQQKEVSEKQERKLLFIIEDAPGPFDLAKRMMALVDGLNNNINAIEIYLTITPINYDDDLFTHHIAPDTFFFWPPKNMDIIFCATLVGPGPWDDMKNWPTVRLVGKFLQNEEIFKQTQQDPPRFRKLSEFINELQKPRWEAIFNTRSRKGSVYMLPESIPCPF